MIRHLLVFVLVALATSAASLWWLHDGDLAAAVAPALPQWDAPTLAHEAGVAEDPAPAPDPDTP